MIKSKKFHIFSLSLIIIFFFILFFDQILKISLEKTFSKWLKRDVQISKIEKDFIEGKLILNDIAVKNIHGENDYLFKSDLIIIDYTLDSLLQGILKINSVVIKNNYINIEFFKINEEIYKDNIDIAEKITLKKPDKIWPKKMFDFNFVINLTEIINLKINIFSNFEKKENIIKFGKIEFRNIGNHKLTKHYKDALREVMTFAVSNLTNDELRKKINEIYRLN